MDIQTWIKLKAPKAYHLTCYICFSLIKDISPDKLEDSVGKWSNTIHGHATRRQILLLSLLQQKNGQSYGYLMPFSVIFQFYLLRKQMMYNNSQTIIIFIKSITH
jgi:hypothetical protein